MAKEHRYEMLPEKDLKLMCKLGLPAARRPKAWFALSGAQGLLAKDPHGFTKYLGQCAQAAEQQAKTAFHQIEKDLDRTFPVRAYVRTPRLYDVVPV